MVLNAKFWSFPIHTYQKQPFLMIILAVRGRGKNLVIDRNSIVKNENLKIFTKTHVIYLKRKLRTCKMQIQVEKVWFVTKKMEKNSRNSKKHFFSKNHTFSFWICIVHVLSILLRYITLMYLKILNFDLFLHIKFQFLPLSFNSQHGQNYSS